MLIRRTPTMLDRAFENWNRTLNAMAQTTNSTFALDVHEQDEAYQMMVELPGVDADQIQLQFVDGTLTIHAESSSNHHAQHGETILQERCYGKFSRSIHFGDTIDEAAINASYDAGILTITLPKEQNAQRTHRARRPAVTPNT